MLIIMDTFLSIGVQIRGVRLRCGEEVEAHCDWEVKRVEEGETHMTRRK